MRALLVLSLFMLVSCSERPSQQSDDEYVLVEFASKLEEEYTKLEPENPSN